MLDASALIRSIAALEPRPPPSTPSGAPAGDELGCGCPLRPLLPQSWPPCRVNMPTDHPSTIRRPIHNGRVQCRDTAAATASRLRKALGFANLAVGPRDARRNPCPGRTFVGGATGRMSRLRTSLSARSKYNYGALRQQHGGAAASPRKGGVLAPVSVLMRARGTRGAE